MRQARFCVLPCAVTKFQPRFAHEPQVGRRSADQFSERSRGWFSSTGLAAELHNAGLLSGSNLSECFADWRQLTSGEQRSPVGHIDRPEVLRCFVRATESVSVACLIFPLAVPSPARRRKHV
jgi:hypothetical protein